MDGVWESLVHAIIVGYMKIEKHVIQNSNSSDGRYCLHEWNVVKLAEPYTPHLAASDINYTVNRAIPTPSLAVSVPATLATGVSKTLNL